MNQQSPNNGITTSLLRQCFPHLSSGNNNKNDGEQQDESSSSSFAPKNIKLHLGSSWHHYLPTKKEPFGSVLIVRKDVSLQHHHTDLVLCLPVLPRGPEYRVFHMTREEWATSPRKSVQAPSGNGKGKQIMVRRVILTRPPQTGYWPPVPATLTWPSLDPKCTPRLEIDALQGHLALALQAVAEWHVFAASPTLSLRASLVAQYGTIPATEQLFQVLVLPFTRGVLPAPISDGYRRAIQHTSEHALQPVSWQDAAHTRPVKEWTRAMGIKALAFLAGTAQVQDFQPELTRHSAWFQQQGLPATALSWCSRRTSPFLQGLLSLETDDTGNNTTYWSAYRHMAADIARWCIFHKPPGLSEQLTRLVQPFIQAWDNTLVQLPERASNTLRVCVWGRLALTMAKTYDTQCPVIQYETILDTEEAHAKTQAAILAAKDKSWRFKDSSLYSYPNKDDRAQRYNQVAASTLARLKALFCMEPVQEHVPACLRSILAQGRMTQRINQPEHWTFACQLILLVPSPAATQETLRVMAEFALGMDVCEHPETHRDKVEELLKTLEQAAKKHAANPMNAGPGCSTVISRSLESRGNDTETQPGYCPFARLRIMKRNSEDNKLVTDDSACVKACAAADNVPHHGYYPLDRLLYSKETEVAGGVLDW